MLFGTLDRVIPPDMGRCYKALMPNCHLVLVYDAGHAISTERPEAFAEVTIDFLERHEAFVISRTETRHPPVRQPGTAQPTKAPPFASRIAPEK